MIGGAALGAFVVGNSGKMIKATFKALPSLFQGSKYTKATYMELMALLYEILDKTRKEGLLAIERDIEAPKESALFKKYPKVLKDHHMVEFITDYLRLMVSGKLNAIEIEALMDREIDTHHHEGAEPAMRCRRSPTACRRSASSRRSWASCIRWNPSACRRRSSAS